MKHIRSRKNLRGMTLLELAIAGSLLAAFGGAAMLATDTAGKSFRTEVVSANLESAARNALGTITHQLRAAGAGEVPQSVVAAPGFTDTIDFRRVVGFDDVADQVLWGDPERIEFEYDPGDPNDGIDNDDDGLVDEGRIVHFINPDTPDERRAVLCNWVSESLGRETPGNFIDDNGNGLLDESGFCVVFDGDRATIRMTLARRDKWGQLIDHTFVKSVTLRNTETP
jgi:hypothetical protein